MDRITIRSINEKVDNTKNEVLSNIKITIKSINEKINNAKNEVLLNINKNKRLIRLIFFFSMACLTLISAGKVFSLDEEVPYNSYNYEIKTYNGLKILNDFEMYHDFSNNQGKISFKINKNDYVEGNDIEIQFPAVVDNKTIEVYYWEENGEKIGWSKRHIIPQQNTKGDYSMIMINDIPFPKNNDQYFYSISYEMEILPHGLFQFYHEGVDFFGRGSLVVFDLGKKYRCYANCIYNPMNIIVSNTNSNKKIMLTFEKTKNHSFILKGMGDIRIGSTFWMGMLVSSFMLLIGLAKEVLEDICYKRK